MNKPYELTAQEWEEVAAVRAVQEGFGLEDEEDPAAWLAEYAYGVRFDYQTDGPGYVGPLYLLQGAGAPETRPMAFIRGGGHDIWFWVQKLDIARDVAARACTGGLGRRRAAARGRAASLAAPSPLHRRAAAATTA